MNKRQRARRAFCPEHRKLLDAYWTARGGDKLRRLRELQQWVTADLVRSLRSPKAETP
jgi:hypothetical protein